MTSLKDIQLFLLDMDGTINLDYRLIDGAAEFIGALVNQGKRYVFLTNNSSKNASDYVEKMRSLGLPCEKENVFTSGMAAGMFLSSHRKGKSVFVVGTRSLRAEIASYGVEVREDNADIVLLGFDRELTYAKLETACELLDSGAEYFATNVDMVCPIDNGRYIPDCGSMADMIENAVHRRPVFIGKPDRAMVDIISEKTGISLSNIAIVGDRIYTDIRTGVNAGITSVLVMSGETDEKTLNESDITPTYTLGSVKDIYKAII
ncbi:MAG: HAD-IIA family hydrolase [Clostridiales bacterium]|nr:HAD-IIA family hydrolase [Clostridiales bacterium]